MKRALVIGINKYIFLRSLSCCVNDATAVANILKTNANGSSNFYVKSYKNTHENPEIPSRAFLVRKIRELFSGEVDTALLYFAGHGHVNEVGGYIMAPDSQKYDEGVSMDEIMSLANNSKSRNKIIILDCCHAGVIGQLNITGNSNHAMISNGVTILTACREDEVAVEKGGHGIFTQLFLDALNGGAADLKGEITPGNVYAYIDRAMGSWGQRPLFKTNVSYFTSIRTVNPRISVEILRKITEYFPLPDTDHPLNPSYEFTNSKKHIPKLKVPLATNDKVSIFKELQIMQSVGLVTPVGEAHMYFAAMNSKSCRLTPLGQYYHQLVKNEII